MKAVITFYLNEANNDLFALIFIDNKNTRSVQAYSSIGQHSDIDMSYVKESKKVTCHREDVKKLKYELLSIGYKF
jgi:hypothetical protein